MPFRCPARPPAPHSEKATVLAERIDELRLAGHITRLDLRDPHVLNAAREFKGLRALGPKVAIIRLSPKDGK